MRNLFFSKQSTEGEEMASVVGGASPREGARPTPTPIGGVIGDPDEEQLDESEQNTLKKILAQLEKNNEKDKDRQEQGHVEQKTWHEALMELLKNNDLGTFGRTMGHAIFSVGDFATKKISGGRTNLTELQDKLNTELEKIPELPGKCINAIKKWYNNEAAPAQNPGAGAEHGAAPPDPAAALGRDPFAGGVGGGAAAAGVDPDPDLNPPPVVQGSPR